MKLFKGLKKLVQNNTGVSSKNFFLVVVTIIGCLLLLVPVVILIVEIIYNKTIQTDLEGLAAYIGAVATIFASAGITKAWSEKFEHNPHFPNHHLNKGEENENGEGEDMNLMGE